MVGAVLFQNHVCLLVAAYDKETVDLLSISDIAFAVMKTF
jgi:hypothetical protein